MIFTAFQIEIWRVENFELEPVDEGTYGFFFGGDSYVLKYTYEINGNERYILYFWQVSLVGSLIDYHGCTCH